MTKKEAMHVIQELSMLKKFPVAPAAQAALAERLMQWCEGDMERARWLVDVGIQGLDEYPGPESLRKIIVNREPANKPNCRSDYPAYKPLTPPED